MNYEKNKWYALSDNKPPTSTHGKRYPLLLASTLDGDMPLYLSTTAYDCDLLGVDKDFKPIWGSYDFNGWKRSDKNGPTHFMVIGDL